LVQAFLKKWWVESDFKAPNLPLSWRLKLSGCHYILLEVSSLDLFRPSFIFLLLISFYLFSFDIKRFSYISFQTFCLDFILQYIYLFIFNIFFSCAGIIFFPWILEPNLVRWWSRSSQVVAAPTFHPVRFFYWNNFSQGIRLVFVTGQRPNDVFIC
jgi:hypothetical protein